MFLPEADRTRLSVLADLLLRRPRSDGLLEFLRMRVLRPCTWKDCARSGDITELERRLRLSPAPSETEFSLSLRDGWDRFVFGRRLDLSGEGERVEMVETDADEKEDTERDRLRDGRWSSMSSSECLRGLSRAS
jgi:hypothetical protein